MAKLIVRAIVALAVAILVSPACVAAPITRVGAEEVKLGKEAAADVEKNNQFVQDSELNARVRGIGEAIAAVANSREVPSTYGGSQLAPFIYTFKIIDDADVNAFSVPGGHVYIYKGLIDICESDHELAAVIAHEVAHAAHHHMIQLMKEQSRLQGRMALVLIASLVGRMRTEDMGNVMMGANFYTTAKINGYGQRAEADADATAITYLTHTSYNPVGMLTFLERLAEHPDVVDWGILQTHPRAGDRVRSVRDQLAELGIEIDRRAVTTSTTALVRPVDARGTVAFDVMVGTRLICKVMQADRAEEIANRINEAFEKRVEFKDVRLRGNTVTAQGVILLEMTDEDAALAGKPASELAADACAALRNVLFKQMVNALW